jgi:radical SAM-linked protein
MVSETPPAVAAAPPGSPERSRDKVRLRFRKDGDLRLLSHHDLMRAFERMLRRADLPFRCSQGYNPRPRLVFALSLPLGVVGCEEVVELELEHALPLEEIEQRLSRQAPPGLVILSARRINPRANAQVRTLCYRVAVPGESVAGLGQCVADVLASAECWVERTRPQRRRLDVRPFLRDLRVVALAADETPPGTAAPTALEMDLWLTPGGTARPDEVLGLLGLQDLLEIGAVLERTRLELHDEITPPLAEGIA